VGLDPGLRRLALGTLLAAYAGPTPPDWAVDLVAEGLAGHTLFGTNIEQPAQVAAATAALRDARRDVLIAIDEEGGDVTRLAHATGSPYPGNAALGAVGDVALTRRVYEAIGGELADLGISVNLAPTVDVNTADENPVIGTVVHRRSGRRALGRGGRRLRPPVSPAPSTSPGTAPPAPTRTWSCRPST
jgi:beta-N-acetylhexosaminidase